MLLWEYVRLDLKIFDKILPTYLIKILATSGTFTIYVDQMRGVGGLPNVNKMSTEGGRGSVQCQRWQLWAPK